MPNKILVPIPVLNETRIFWQNQYFYADMRDWKIKWENNDEWNYHSEKNLIDIESLIQKIHRENWKYINSDLHPYKKQLIILDSFLSKNNK